MVKRRSGRNMARLIDQYKADILNDKALLDEIDEKWEKRAMQKSGLWAEEQTSQLDLS